jgi:hypothetical protein
MSARSEAFDARFDNLVRIYEDPIEVLFKIMSGTIEMGPDFINEEGQPVFMPVQVSDRKSAAAELMSYRYSKRKALEIVDGDGNEGFSFVMLAPGQKQQEKSLPVGKKALSPPLAEPRAEPSGKALPEDHVPAHVEFA